MATFNPTTTSAHRPTQSATLADLEAGNAAALRSLSELERHILRAVRRLPDSALVELLEALHGLRRASA